MATERPGRYFLIRNSSNKLTIEVPVAAYEVYVPPKTPLYMWVEKSVSEGNQSQLWYEDRPTSTIRCKLNHYCIDVENDHVMVSPFKAGSSSQQWRVEGNRIVSVTDSNRVLDLSTEDLGSAICVAPSDSDSETQSWNIEHKPSIPFYITSKLHGKVVDVKENSTKAGAEVIFFSKKSTIELNQLWYEDADGIVRSRLNDFALEPDKKGFMYCQPYDPKNSRQKWVITGEVIVNRHNAREAWDVFEGKKKDRVPLFVYELHGGPNQQFIFEYVNV